MAFNSNIQWTQATWNPWHGCKKVSPGCKYCYMYRGKEQYKQDPKIVQRSKTRFNDPLKWTEGRVIFTCSWSDFFIDEADAWRLEAWQIVLMTRGHHFYQILTKHPERIEEQLPTDFDGDKIIPDNVIFIASVENQEMFDKRWPILRDLKKRYGMKVGLSVEPLLGPIDMHDAFVEDWNWKHQPDWVIVGGESGNEIGKYRYRKCEMEWVENIVLKCRELGISVFVKQLGTYLAKELHLKSRSGGDIEEWPNHCVKVREMPEIIKLVS